MDKLKRIAREMAEAEERGEYTRPFRQPNKDRTIGGFGRGHVAPCHVRKNATGPKLAFAS